MTPPPCSTSSFRFPTHSRSCAPRSMLAATWSSSPRPAPAKRLWCRSTCCDAPWRGDDRILMLEPRRLATRAAATRMAFLLGQPVGQTIGYRTRLDGAGSAETRVEVITEGLLLRRLQSDPGLDGVAAVILDEIHERSLESDLGLALCLDLQRMLRPELRLLAMSATADGARLSGLMDADVIESAGRQYPVTVEHSSARHRLPIATCRTPSPERSASRWNATRATSSPSSPEWRKSVALRPHWTPVARWCCRSTATCLPRSRTARSVPPRAAASCWRPPSPRPH